MKKSYQLDGQKVKIVKDLELKQPSLNGKTMSNLPLIDKDGHWFQVEFLTGPNKGNRKPAAQKSLT